MGVKFKRQEREMLNLKYPEHSLLHLCLAKVIAQDPVSRLVEHRKGVQAIWIPVAVVCKGTFGDKYKSDYCR